MDTREAGANRSESNTHVTRSSFSKPAVRCPLQANRHVDPNRIRRASGLGLGPDGSPIHTRQERSKRQVEVQNRYKTKSRFRKEELEALWESDT